MKSIGRRRRLPGVAELRFPCPQLDTEVFGDGQFYVGWKGFWDTPFRSVVFGSTVRKLQKRKKQRSDQHSLHAPISFWDLFPKQSQGTFLWRDLFAQQSFVPGDGRN